MSEKRRSYAGYRLLPAALGILDEDGDPRVRGAISHEHTLDDQELVWIDWGRLEDELVSSTECARVEIARSLLDGTPVKLSATASFGSGTYGLLMRSPARSWPEPPPDVDELIGRHGWREITPPPVDPPEEHR